MRLMAIDPGPVESAWVLWNPETEKIHDFGKHPNDAVLEMIDPRTAYILAIEMIASYGMAVGAEVFETCVWIGRFTQQWESFRKREFITCDRFGLAEPLRVERLDIKLHHCHDSKAKDTNIRAALIDRLGAPGTKAKPGATYGVSKDVWAALALAVCVGDRMGFEKAKRRSA